MRSYPNISRGTGGVRRARAMLGGTLAAATVISLGIADTAQAAVAPTADLSLSSTTINVGTQGLLNQSRFILGSFIPTVAVAERNDLSVWRAVMRTS